MQKRNRAVKKIILYVILAVFVIAALFPIYWMLNTSLKPNNEIYNLIPTFFPKKISLDGYKRLFFKTGFFTHMKNSIMVSSVTSVVSVFFSMLAAYAIARFRFRGKNLISRGIIYSYLMPRSVMYIPLYLFVVQVGLNNSLGALYLIYPTFVIPYATWMLISYFKSIPKELEDAALIDGCTRIGTLRRIIFPLSLPGIMSTIIFSFTLCWSEYLYAFVIISDDLQKTITLGLSDLIVDDLYAWGALMGGAAISTIPVVLLYMFSSGYLVTGNVAGGVKG
ncbi:ABC transporter, permease protein [Clostridiales bacterium 1_7_47FAA]|nr:ABC transporter, permease protein [Clostridiales bacterium 1_7_47FAA]